MNVGVDVGGTFTDAVAWDGERLVTAKTPTTDPQTGGVVEALEAVDARGARLVHGTTAATNAVLTRTGARTVLVTDAGFEDLIEIGRQDRPSLYDVEVTRAEPLVASTMRIGVAGRSGGVTVNVDEVDWDEVASRVADLEPEAVAVSMLHAYRDERRERSAAESLRRLMPEVAVSLSCLVTPEFREFERTSTTVLDAYLRPVVSRYLMSLRTETERDGRVVDTSVMRSSGGLLGLDEAADLPVATLLSGPAAGVVAAAALGEETGRDRVISFDMGGTSTDVCRVERGRPDLTYERSVGGLPCRMPSVAVHTVGAGGGSVAWVDSGGALRVGPRSAGAVPGPAAYGRGGREATVTDANLALGRIDADARLGGSLALDLAASLDALRRLAGSAGLSLERAALGIVDIVESHMERAVRRVSVEDGVDPRGATLVAFGGAGGLHATSLARRLDMAGVVIPALPGVFSALGLLLSPPRHDEWRTTAVDAVSLDAVVADVVSSAQVAGGPAESSVTIDLRYVGQSHETPVSYTPGEGWEALEERFHEAHRVRNGFSRPGSPVEAVTIRVETVGRPALRWGDLPAPRPSGEAERGRRNVMTASGDVDASVWWRPALRPGDEVAGPAVIEEAGATAFLGSGERAVVTGSGALEISW